MGGGIQNVTPTDNAMSLERLNKAVRSNHYAEKIKAIRALTTKNERNLLKVKLDYVSAGGTFTTRNELGLIERSGIFCLDFDEVADLRKLKADLISKLTPALFFLSPSGDGLKVFYSVNVSAGSHLEYFKAFEAYFKAELNISIDKQCKDVSRACFMSNDGNSYFNEQSLEIGKEFLNNWLPVALVVVDHVRPQQIESDLSEFDQCEVIRKNIERKGETFTSGNRNKYIGVLSAGLNRIGISQSTALNYLLRFEQTDFLQTEIQNTVHYVYKHTEKHNTSPLTTSINESNTLPKKPKKKHYTALENPFPVDVFPPLFRALILNTKDTLNFPVDYSAASMLAAVSTAIGKTALLEVKTGWREFAPLYLGLIGNAGAAKSHPLDMFFRILEEIDREEYKTFEPLYNKYLQWLALSKKEKKAVQEVKEPVLIKSIMNNFTPEILNLRLSENDRACCVVSEELESWLLGMNQYSKSDTSSTYLSMWSVKRTTIDRVGKAHKPTFIERPYLSIIGTLQPRKLKQMFPVEKSDSGFLQRFIWAYPVDTKKEYITTRQMNESLLEVYNDWIRNYIKDNNATTYSSGQPMAKVYKFNEASKDYFYQWQKANTDKVNAAGDSLLSEELNKFDNHYLRLCLLLELMAGGNGSIISLESAKGAEKLCTYFENTMYMVLDNLEAGIKESKGVDKLEVANYLMNECGYSQNKAADTIGVSKQYLSKIKN